MNDFTHEIIERNKSERNINQDKLLNSNFHK